MPSNDALENPYIGLKSFEEQDAPLFFGRERSVGQLEQLIRAHHFVAVLGGSGVGKTSLVKAGLIPKVAGSTTPEGGQWHKIAFRIGTDPMQNLAEQLVALSALQPEDSTMDAERWLSVLKVKLKRSENTLTQLLESIETYRKDRFLIVTDQFEEIFRLVNSQSTELYEQAVEFFKLIIHAVTQHTRIHVAMVMRSDYTDQAHLLPGLVELLNQSYYLVPQMTREELKMAITEPTKRAGASLTSSLTFRFLNDMGTHTDQLPVLQHTLMRTWEFHMQKNNESTTLDLPDYEAVGGIERALEQHAEEIYHILDSDEKKLVTEKLFKAITEKEEDKPAVRSPKTYSQLKALTKASDAVLKEVIATFSQPGRDFLVSPPFADVKSDTLIDITHESIMQLWGRLHKWIQEEQEAVTMYRQLCQQAELYHEGKAGALENPQLDVLLFWYEHQKPTEAWGQQYDPSYARAITYLKHSKSAYDFEQQQREIRQKKRLKNARRLALLMGVLSMLTLILFIYAIIARVETQANAEKALKAKQQAEMEKKSADSLRIEAEAQRSIALEQSQEALEQKQIANLNKEQAEQERERALLNAAEARRQEKLALKQQAEALRLRNLAVAQESLALEQKQIAEIERSKADSLRLLANSAKERAEALRMVSVGRALAIRSSKIERQRQKELKALLAIQAFRYNQKYEGNPYDAEIFDALSQANRALNPVENRTFNTIKPVYSLAFSSGTLFYERTDGKIVLQNILAEGKFADGALELKNCKTKACEATDFAFIGTERVVSGHRSGELKLWDKNSQALLATSNKALLMESPVIALSIDNAQNTALAVAENGTIQEFSLTDLQPTATRFSLENPIQQAVWINDYLYFRTLQNTMGMFRKESQQTEILAEQVTTLLAQGTTVWAQNANNEVFSLQEGKLQTQVALSHPLAQGKLLGVSAQLLLMANAQKVALFPIQQPTLKPMQISLEEGEVIRTATLAANGTYVVVATVSHQLLLFPTDMQQMANENCQNLAEPLSQEEWEQYIGYDIPYEPTCNNL